MYFISNFLKAIENRWIYIFPNFIIIATVLEHLMAAVCLYYIFISLLILFYGRRIQLRVRLHIVNNDITVVTDPSNSISPH